MSRGPARRIAVALALVCSAGALLPLLVLAGIATPPAGGCAPSADLSPLASDEVPAQLTPIYGSAAARYRLGPLGPAVLAAINSVETDFGRNLSVSSAGAVGWMQFMPETWRTYGVDADGDGRADPYSPADAIHGAARYLRASGAPADWSRAILAYNHADWYVDRVLARARRYAGAPSGADEAALQLTPGSAACDGLDTTQPPGAARHVTFAGRWLAALPGFPGERCDERIIADVLLLAARYQLAVSDCFGLGEDRGGPHATGGEHPLGLALDAGPAHGDWDLVDQLARDLGWRRACAASGCEGAASLNAALRAIYYTGYPGHGRGDHIHISWKHAPAAPYTPASWAAIFTAPPAPEAATDNKREDVAESRHVTRPDPQLTTAQDRSGPAERSGTARAQLGQGSGTARAQRHEAQSQNPCVSGDSAGGVLADTSRFTVFRARSRTGIVDRAACGGPLAALATSPGERALRSPGRPRAVPAPGRLAATDGVLRHGGLAAAVRDPQGQRRARRLRRSRIPRRHAGGAQDRHHDASLLGGGR